MKINDVHFRFHNGRVVLCRLNKRGQVASDFKDVTDEFLCAVIGALVLPKDKRRIYTASDGKSYSVDVTELSQEDLAEIEKSRKIGSRNARLKMTQFMAFLEVSPYGNLAKFALLNKNKR